MSYTDPSGYFFSWIGDAIDNPFKEVNSLLGDFAPIASLVITIYFGVDVTSWYEAATVGFVTGGISSGSLRGALEGSLSAVVFYNIGKHFKAKFGADNITKVEHFSQRLEWACAHALAGGALTALAGGKFGHGFISAGVTKLAGSYLLDGLDRDSISDQLYATVVSMAIGGTTSMLTGGKFGNDAEMAMYQTAYNFFVIPFIIVAIEQVAISAAAYTATATAGIIGGVAIHENIIKPMMNESSEGDEVDFGAGGRLPSLDGMSEEEAVEVLEENGFVDMGTSEGIKGESRRKFYHPDGSKVQIGVETGKVSVTGTKQIDKSRSDDKKYPPYLDKNRNKIKQDLSKKSHDTGEYINRINKYND